MMTVEQIVKAMAEDCEHEVFGLRVDISGKCKGERLENSHQWFQDWQDHWGDEMSFEDPDHPYNDEMGCWDDGELDGTCSIGIMGHDAQDVEAALKLARGYYQGKMDSMYLIGGDWAQGGNDIGEWIIAEAEVVAEIEKK